MRTVKIETEFVSALVDRATSVNRPTVDPSVLLTRIVHRTGLAVTLSVLTHALVYVDGMRSAEPLLIVLIAVSLHTQSYLRTVLNNAKIITAKF